MRLQVMAAFGVLAGCGTPTPNNLVRIDIPGMHRFAVSTEDGLIALDHGDLLIDQYPVAFPYRDAEVSDEARLVNRADDLALLKLTTARFEFSEFAAEGPLPQESLYVQIIDRPRREWEPELIEVCLYHDGEFGDLLQVEGDRSAESLAADFPGAGVYALRKGRYVLVGILAGTVSSHPSARGGDDLLLPYLSLDAVARVLPHDGNFFARRARQARADFEYGLTPDGREPPEGTSWPP